jgi:hypothetical protein
MVQYSFCGAGYDVRNFYSDFKSSLLNEELTLQMDELGLLEPSNVEDTEVD